MDFEHLTFEPLNFEQLNLIPELLRAIADEKYETPTPIQQQAIPQVLEGRDLLGCAQTGTGKTAAFALPILQQLFQRLQEEEASSGSANTNGNRKPAIRALILSPTRELASQIEESFAAYGRYTPLRHTVVFGGVRQLAQVKALQRGVDILVATPGRLMDLMYQGYIDLSKVEIFVLDEADRMLDMGFIGDIRKIISHLPEQYQTLFFSATLPPEIQKLADTLLHNPARVEVTPVSSTTEQIRQEVYIVDRADKRSLLRHLLYTTEIERALIFTRSKAKADMLVRYLNQNKIRSEAIHSDKSQGARQSALANFKSGHTHVLVATDIASRGIDVDGISHVINFDLPQEPETYVHRIGRTGRAGASGIALSFCDPADFFYLADIEQLIQQQIPIATEHPFLPDFSSGASVGNAAPPPRPRRTPNSFSSSRRRRR